MKKTLNTDNLTLRAAKPEDAERLHVIEKECFATDQLSLRRIRHWIKAPNKVMLVAENDDEILG